MPNLYDEVPYDGAAQVLSHPNRLAAMARLFGVNAAPPERCRVLDIGCAAGENLIPMAESLPGREGVRKGIRDLEGIRLPALHEAVVVHQCPERAHSRLHPTCGVVELGSLLEVKARHEIAQHEPGQDQCRP